MYVGSSAVLPAEINANGVAVAVASTAPLHANGAIQVVIRNAKDVIKIIRAVIAGFAKL